MSGHGRRDLPARSRAVEISWIMKQFLIAYLVAAALVFTATAGAQDESLWYQQQADGSITIKLWFFWSKECRHCQRARPVIESMAAKHPWLQLESRELTADAENRQQFREIAALFKREARSVPSFFFCKKMMVGFGNSEATGKFLLEQLQSCKQKLEQGKHLPLTGSTVGQGEISRVMGIDTRDLPLPVLTVIIAGLDAFNPCAFFILLFLLSLMIHVNNRKRMLLVGGVFILFSGLIYFIFMAAWLNMFLLIGALAWVTAAAGILAATMGIMNVKDAFLAAGPSLSIPENAKPGLYARMRKLMNSNNLPAMLTGTIVLAIAANSYELLCTSGLPMIYTRLLTLESLPMAGYYLYLVFYNIIYILPLLAIVLVFVMTLGSRKLQPHEGRALKLLSGLMMLSLGLVLLIKPDLLSHVTVTLAIIVTSVLISFISYRIGRRKMPGGRA